MRIWKYELVLGITPWIYTFWRLWDFHYYIKANGGIADQWEWSWFLGPLELRKWRSPR